MYSPIGNFRTLLKLRVCNPLPFIYNGYHCQVLKKDISSPYADVLNRKTFTLPQRSLDFSINKFVGKNSNIYISNIWIVRFKSSKSKSSKTQDDEDSDSDSDEAIEFADLEVKLPLLNLDSLLKVVLKLDKRGMQDYIEEEKIKINRGKAYSLEDMIQEGDKIDITVESVDEPPEILRLEVMKEGKMDSVTKKHKVLIRKYPKFHPKDGDEE